MNEELKDYTVLSAEGIDVAGIEYLEGQTVSLSDADAQAYLEAGTVAVKAAEEAPAEEVQEQQ